MAWRDGGRDRALLAAWIGAAFAISGCTDLRLLAAAAAGALLVLRHGAVRSLRRALLAGGAPAAALAAGSWAFLRALGGAPPVEPFAALVLRASLLAFVGFSVVARVDLLRAFRPSPTATRLLVVTLAQIHALRLLATESRLGLRSRLLRKPGALDVARGAAGVTGALFTLSARNARDVADAMRSRGF